MMTRYVTSEEAAQWERYFEDESRWPTGKWATLPTEEMKRWHDTRAALLEWHEKAVEMLAELRRDSPSVFKVRWLQLMDDGENLTAEIRGKS